MKNMATSNSKSKTSAPASPQKNSPEPSAKQTENQTEPTTPGVTTEVTDQKSETETSNSGTPSQTENPDQEKSEDQKDSSPSDDDKTDEPVAGGTKPKTTTKHEPVAPKGRILKAGDPLKFDGETVGNMVIVKEDVYREKIARGSSRKTYTLVYTKGTSVPASILQEG